MNRKSSYRSFSYLACSGLCNLKTSFGAHYLGL
jgi:hypothetical protein